MLKQAFDMPVSPLVRRRDQVDVITFRSVGLWQLLKDGGHCGRGGSDAVGPRTMAAPPTTTGAHRLGGSEWTPGAHRLGGPEWIPVAPVAPEGGRFAALAQARRREPGCTR